MKKTDPLPAVWLCHARPAATGGKTCGFLNEHGGVPFGKLTCCASCGSTKIASDARAPSAIAHRAAVRRASET